MSKASLSWLIIFSLIVGMVYEATVVTVVLFGCNTFLFSLNCISG